ncbi:MAG: CoA-binding protein [bacterium]|nr:CoA-binding protein [bacterium]
MTQDERIRAFLDGGPFAVAGASTKREKYGNKVLRCYVQDGRVAFPLNPRAETIEGLTCYPDFAALPEVAHGASFITPPAITDVLVEEAAAAGVQHAWMQPGAESPVAIERAEELGLNVIAGGACLLVVLGFRE